MNKDQMKNKISQMLYRPNRNNEQDEKSEKDEKDDSGLEDLDSEIDKLLNEVFGKKRKRK